MRSGPGIGYRFVAGLSFGLLGCSFALAARAQERSDSPKPGRRASPQQARRAPAEVRGERPTPAAGGRQTRKGLILNTRAAFFGYTLIAPLTSTKTYLVDLNGKLVHSWPGKHAPGQAVYLLDDGSLLRCERQPRNRDFGGGGIGGRVVRIARDGKLLWEFVYADEKHCLHHDVKPMPNGHVLMIAWEKKTRDEALAAGRDEDEMTGEEMWPDCMIEVEPRGASGGRIVWEWHLWDHLVQEINRRKPNFGVVAEHSELVDLNYRPRAPRETPAEMERLRSLGYMGGAPPKDEEEGGGGPPRFGPGPGMGRGPGGVDMRADWCHTNAIDYNARLDQIALSVHNFNEIWIIDHGTTAKEAAGHNGGRYGRGGDLLYRWGNPRAYGAGGAKDQRLFAQHDVRWIPKESPGAGHLMVFNNGPGRPDGRYSSIVEIAAPMSSRGDYRRETGKAFDPAEPTWEYTAPNRADFFASHISGAQRLANGNTLICSGEEGRVFEVNAAGKTVWDYVNPYRERDDPDGGPGPFGGPPPWGPWRWDGRRNDRQSNESGIHGDSPNGPSGRGEGGPPGVGPWGPPGGGPGGPRGGRFGRGPEGGLFRATRLAADHPGIRRILATVRGK